MHISEFDYELPEELIAQEPLESRAASRMLIVNRRTESWTDSLFKQFPAQLNQEDVVVLNNTRVIPARLLGTRKETGGRVEIFLVKEVEPQLWQALVRPGNRLRGGSVVTFGDGRLTAEITDDPGKELRLVRFHCEGSFESLLTQFGATPLPPYIKRPQGVSANDKERYQTTYAKYRGAIAAPTAGLHFSDEILSQVKERSHLAEITLHVGYGTFEPVRAEDINEHRVSPESFEISARAAELINQARSAGGRVVAVGTTTMRTLESAPIIAEQLTAGQGEADLTITPGYRFHVVSALLTNFHLPQSSLLLLVSAFAGRELILEAYRYAVSQRYRFYSYGDCMLIV